MSARFRSCLVGAVALVASSIGLAADQVVTVPSGWSVCPYRFAASSQGVALMLYPTTSDPFVSTSKIMLVGLSGTTTLTELPGKAFAIAFSPNGSYLLVHHNGSDGPKVSLLSGTTGSVIWTKTAEPRLFEFSATGTVIAARKVKSEWTASGSTIEVFDLTGTSLRTVDLNVPVTGAVLANGDSNVILALGQTLAAFDFSQVPMARTWSLDLGSSDGPLIGVSSLGTDRFMASEELGRFKVIKWNGTVDYTFDPTTLAAGDPGRPFKVYASYNAYPTPLANKLLLYNGTYDALLLDLTTGNLTSKALNMAFPQGFKVIPQVGSGRLVAVSDTQVLVRSINF